MTAPDLFASYDKSPSVSFKNATPGTSVALTVTAVPTEQQAKNYDTGKPDYWDDGTPKKVILVKGTVNGVEHALWVTRGTSLFAAVAQAQKEAGAPIGVGGVLTVTFTHSIPSSKGDRFNPVRQFSALYVPPSVFTQPAPPAVHTAAVPPAPAVPAVPAVPATPALTPEAIAALQGMGITLPQ